MSQVFRHDGGFGWSGIFPATYKSGEDSWRGVSRRVFVGETGESTDFHVRYFEVEPGGFTTLERHLHEHCVVVIRGHGQAVLGGVPQDLAFGDVVYVAPDDPHQFRNDGGTSPFGFFCIVDAERDPPRPVSG